MMTFKIPGPNKAAAADRRRPFHPRAVRCPCRRPRLLSYVVRL